jgi:membrane-associated protein
MHYRRFVAYNVLGGAAWCLGLLTLGWALGSRLPGIADYLDVVIVGIVLLSVIPIGVHLLRLRAHGTESNGLRDPT